jgi:hypothetical protein
MQKLRELSRRKREIAEFLFGDSRGISDARPIVATAHRTVAIPEMP